MFRRSTAFLVPAATGGSRAAAAATASNPILRINAGGTIFDTYLSTAAKYGPEESGLAYLATTEAVPYQTPVQEALGHVGRRRRKQQPSAESEEAGAGANNKPEQLLFLDVDPAVFKPILNFLRTDSIILPVKDEVLRSDIVHQLTAWNLVNKAFPKSTMDSDPMAGNVHGAKEGDHGGPTGGDEAPRGPEVILPDVLAVQVYDQVSLVEGTKRHAMTITYGADGLRLRDLCKVARRDLKSLMSSTYWQMYQTGERSAFFISTKMSDGSADLLVTSVSQRLVEHTEKMGYSLASSYVTLSPDARRIASRNFIHWFIFRRVRSPSLDLSDLDAVVLAESAGGSEGEGALEREHNGEGVGSGFSKRDMADGMGIQFEAPSEADDEDGDEEVYKNFEAPRVGPQGPAVPRPTIPAGQKVEKIWK